MQPSVCLQILCEVACEFDDDSMSQGRKSTGRSKSSRLSLVLIGNCGVGKSSVLSKFVDGTCDVQALNTIGIDFRRKFVEIAGQTLQLQVWDTAGQEKFNSIPSMYCRNADGLIIVYDVQNGKSFEGISFWLNNLRIYAPPDVEVLLLGNKHDLDAHVVTHKMGEQAARKIGALFFEVSAKTGHNIEPAFKAFAEVVWNKRQGGIKDGIHDSASSSDDDRGAITIVENSEVSTDHVTTKKRSSACCGR